MNVLLRSPLYKHLTTIQIITKPIQILSVEIHKRQTRFYILFKLTQAKDKMIYEKEQKVFNFVRYIYQNLKITKNLKITMAV